MLQQPHGLFQMLALHTAQPGDFLKQPTHFTQAKLARAICPITKCAGVIFVVV
jgi:hypothetical protein